MQLFLSSSPILLLLISLLLANCNLANGRENEEVDESMLIEQLHDSLLHSNPVNQHRLPPPPLSSPSSSDSDSEDLGSLSWNPESDSHPDGEEHHYKLPKLSDRIIQHLMNVQFSKQDVDDLKHLVKLEEAIKHSHNQAKTPRYCTCSNNAGKKEKSKLKRKKSKANQQDKERKRPLIEVNVLPCGGNQQPTNANTSTTQLVTIKSVVYQTHTTHKPITTTTSSAEDETETITMTNTAEPTTGMTKTQTVTMVSSVTPIVPTATVTITERVTVTSTKSKTLVYVTVTKPTPTLSESSEVVMTVITPAL